MPELTGNTLPPREEPFHYDTRAYYDLNQGKQVLATHKALASNHEVKPYAYWDLGSKTNSFQTVSYEGLNGIPFIVRYGRIGSFSKEYLACFVDTTAKSNFDQPRTPSDLTRDEEITEYFGNYNENLLLASVEYNGRIISGAIVQPGSGTELVASRIGDPSASIPTLRANFDLQKTPLGQALAQVREDQVTRLTRYFRIPNNQLEEIFLTKNDADLKEIIKRVSMGVMIARAKAASESNRNIQFIVGETCRPNHLKNYVVNYGMVVLDSGPEDEIWPPDRPGPTPRDSSRTWWVTATKLTDLLAKTKAAEVELQRK